MFHISGEYLKALTVVYEDLETGVLSSKEVSSNLRLAPSMSKEMQRYSFSIRRQADLYYVIVASKTKGPTSLTGVYAFTGATYQIHAADYKISQAQYYVEHIKTTRHHNRGRRQP